MSTLLTKDQEKLSSHPNKRYMPQTSERIRRGIMRERAIEEASRKRDAETRRKLRNTIELRLAEVPVTWRTRYHTLLRDQNINPNANLSHVTNLDSLKTRVALLPPKTVYVHMTNAKHPSLPEARVVHATIRTDYTRMNNKRDCTNASAFSMRTLVFPERANVAQIKPNNLIALTLPDGHTECVNIATLKATHRRGYTFAKSYQRDAQGDEWAEMRVDTHHHGTVRLPLWILNKTTGLALAPTKDRIHAPHETTYA